MRDDLLISEIEFYQIIVSFPALIPQAVVIIGIAVKADMEPVFIGRVLPVFDHILKLQKAAADMIEYTVKNDTDPVLVELFADVTEILVRPQADIDLLIISGVISMCVGFKQRAEIDCVNPQLLHMRNPFGNLPDSVQFHLFFRIALVGKRSSAESQCIDLIKNAVFSPHSISSCPAR